MEEAPAQSDLCVIKVAMDKDRIVGFRFASIAVRPGRNTDPVNGQGSWPSSATVGSSRSSSIVASASAV